MPPRRRVRTLDFRSDTLTQPTDAMRQAMAEAEVGDDVFGEDPTIQALEEAAADRMGMEAALFVPSGTMANQIAAWVHTERQGQIVCEENCHMALYEGGAASLLSGAMLRTVRGERGVFGPPEMRPHILPDDPHFAKTKLVAVENTHNWAGGTVWSPDALAETAAFAHARGAAVHMDGARIFNAAVADDLPPTAWTSNVDSVMFCLSKGLSAPVGSLLCGSEAFIHAAHRVRKVLGGGMRQAGVIAAAGLVALDGMVDRLADDHAHAARLAEGLATIPTLELLAEPETNILYADISDTGLTGEDFMALAKDVGVLCLPRDAGPVIRFVTHRHVTAEDCDEAVQRLRGVLEDTSGA